MTDEQAGVKDKRGPYVPRSVQLPHGFVIAVRQLSPTQMKATHGQDYDGIWDVDKMHIDLKSSLPRQRKWYVFSHELVHAVNDWAHWLVNQEIAQG